MTRELTFLNYKPVMNGYALKELFVIFATYVEREKNDHHSIRNVLGNICRGAANL